MSEDVTDSAQLEMEEIFGQYDLGDGLELDTLSADTEGRLKFMFTWGPECASGEGYRDMFTISEEAWRTLTAHVRVIDLWLLQCKHEVLDLSIDTTLTTLCTASRDRYVRLRTVEKSGRVKRFELTYTAWTFIVDAHQRIDYNAHKFRRYC
jgi:hypothetical protein